MSSKGATLDKRGTQTLFKRGGENHLGKMYKVGSAAVAVVAGEADKRGKAVR